MFATVPPPSSTPFNLGSGSASSPVAASGWKPVQGVTPYLDPSSTQVNPALLATQPAAPPTTQPSTPAPAATGASPWTYQYSFGSPEGATPAQLKNGSWLQSSPTYSPQQDLAGAPGVSQAQSLANMQTRQNQVMGLPPWYQPSFANTPAPRGGYGGFGGDANSGGGGSGGSSW